MSFLLGLMRAMIIGKVKEVRVSIMMEACMVATFIWSCTNIFGS